jgi:hypothetical protein
VSAQTTLAEEQWPELPRVLTQLQEMPYASPASSVSVTGDEPDGTDAAGPGDVKEWRPKLRGYRPFSCSSIRADVRTDDFFTEIAPVLERAGARVEMTSPLRHSKDVANRARSAVSSLRRYGPRDGLRHICVTKSFAFDIYGNKSPSLKYSDYIEHYTTETRHKLVTIYFQQFSGKDRLA